MRECGDGDGDLESSRLEGRLRDDGVCGRFLGFHGGRGFSVCSVGLVSAEGLPEVLRDIWSEVTTKYLRYLPLRLVNELLLGMNSRIDEGW